MSYITLKIPSFARVPIKLPQILIQSGYKKIGVNYRSIKKQEQQFNPIVYNSDCVGFASNFINSHGRYSIYPEI